MDAPPKASEIRHLVKTHQFYRTMAFFGNIRSLLRSPSPLSPPRFSLLLALLIIMPFHKVVFGLETFFFRDFGSYGYPAAFYFRESFWRGEIPLWNPFNECGMPFLAQWNTLVCYPFSIFYLIFPLSWSLGVFVLGHVYVGGLGMYFLVRRRCADDVVAAVAGTALVFNGLTFSWLMWPNAVVFFAWMPWLFLTVDRAWKEGGRHIITASVVGALQMFSGVPEFIAINWLILIFLGIVDCTSGRFEWPVWFKRGVTVIVIITALTAIQLLPFLELLKYSQRNASFAGDEWSLPFAGLGNFFVPLFKMNRSSLGVFLQEKQGLFTSYYQSVGIWLLVLTGIGRVDRRTFALWIVLLVSILFALGNSGVVWPFLKKLVPELGAMRYPVKFLVPLIFVLPLLAAESLKKLSVSNSASPRRILFWAGLISLATIWVLWVARSVMDSNLWPGVLTNGIIRLGVVACAAVIACLWVSKASRQNRTLVAVGFIALTWIDALTHVPNQNPTLPLAAYTPRLPIFEEMQPRPVLGEFRAALDQKTRTDLAGIRLSDPLNAYLCNRLILFANCNLLEEIPKTDGFFPLSLRWYNELLAIADLSSTELRPGLGDFMGICQVPSGKDLEWKPRRGARPMIAAGSMPVFVDANASLSFLLDEFDPETTVFLAEGKGEIEATNRSDIRIVSTKVSGHKIEIVSDSTTPGLITIAQAHYPPWRAAIDGKRVPLWRANHTFQCIEVPRGRHAISVVYDDRAFKTGAVISTLAASGCLLAWFFLKRTRSPAAPHL